MRPLTLRQEEVLQLIKTTMIDTGMPPTRAEIARELGFK
jgi:repressor LexA